MSFGHQKVKCISVGPQEGECVSFDLIKGDIGDILGYSSSFERFDGQFDICSEGSKGPRYTITSKLICMLLTKFSREKYFCWSVMELSSGYNIT